MFRPVHEYIVSPAPATVGTLSHKYHLTMCATARSELRGRVIVHMMVFDFIPARERDDEKLSHAPSVKNNVRIK